MARRRAPARILGIVPPSESASLEALAHRAGSGAVLRLEASVAAGLRALAEGPWDVTVLSVREGVADTQVAARVVSDGRGGAVLLTTPTASVELSLEAERLGAAGLVREPLDPEELGAAVLPLLSEQGGLEVPPIDADGGEHVVASSRAMSSVFELVARVATTSATVLLTGESGTGKEVVARAIHRASRRREHPFVAVNCAAIPEHLLEAELFGHERGAFTGAVARKEGRFGRADGGTLFLDEIGDMGVSLQAKILRALEEGEIERLGSEATVAVDVRIIAATNQPLSERVAEQTFREDLFFRLAVVQIELPPLRERPDDLHALLLHFAATMAARYERPVRFISDAAVARLEAHAWPGNVRELRNVMDRAVLLARGDTVRSSDLRLGDDAPHGSPRRPEREAAYSPALSLSEVEGRHIAAVLRHTRGHMGEAAKILGVHRNTMTTKVREHGIDLASLGGSS
jgi:two-component system, NtrC family, response regulator HydG